MIGVLTQKGLGLFSRGTPDLSPDRIRLIELLDMLVDECDRGRNTELVEDDLALMPDRYYSLARAAAQGHYRIEPDRIAERLMRH